VLGLHTFGVEKAADNGGKEVDAAFVIAAIDVNKLLAELRL
jgi:hypothetical protein